MDAAPGSRLSVHGCVLGARYTRLAHYFEPIAIAPGMAPIALEARWPEPVVLHVVDRESKEPLREVVVVPGRRDYGGETPVVWCGPYRVHGPMDLTLAHAHPGARAAAPIGPPACSPLTLQLPPDADVPRVTVHVRAPGYAWARVDLDFDQGGEQRSELDRAGALDVIVAGVTPGTHTVLRIRRGRHLPICELPIGEDGTVAIEGLPVGRLAVRAEVGEGRDELGKRPYGSEDDTCDPPSHVRTDILASECVEVAPGARRAVTLRLAPIAVPPRVSVGGTVVLPEGWDVEQLSLWLHLLDVPVLGDATRWLYGQDMLAVPDAVRTWTWRVDDMPCGRYEIQLHREMSFAQIVEVGPFGRADIALRVSPPAEVTVRVLDGEGHPLACDFGWHLADSELGGGGLWLRARDEEPGVHRVRAAHGRYRLVMHRLEDYPDHEQIVTVAAPAVDVVVRLVRRIVQGFELELVGDVPPSATRPRGGWLGKCDLWDALEWTVMLSLRDERGERVGVSWSGTGAKRTFKLDGPGRYTFEVALPDDFVPVPTQRVDIATGVIARHTIALERRTSSAAEGDAPPAAGAPPFTEPA